MFYEAVENKIFHRQQKNDTQNISGGKDLANK